MSAGISGLGKPYPYWGATYETPQVNQLEGYVFNPIGDVTFTASQRNPVGFLICDGSIYNSNAFPDLSLSIGSNYLTNSNTPYSYWSSNSFSNGDFYIPNLNSLFALGGNLVSNSTSNFTNVNVNGGSSSVTLSVSNVPPHEHRQLQPGGTSLASTSGNRTGDPNTSGPLTQADIYDYNGNLITASNASPTAVTIPKPPYQLFNSLIRTDYKINTSWIKGYINIDATNDQFYAVVLTSLSPSITYSTYAVTLSNGAFTIPQMLSNITGSIGNAISNAQSAPCSCTLSNYSYNTQGNYVYKIILNSTSPNANAYGVGFGFTTASTSASLHIPTPNRVIPQNILDACADTLGFQTRTNYGQSPGSGTYSYNTGYGGTYDYICPPKAFKIYWGSEGDATMPSYLLSNVINSF